MAPRKKREYPKALGRLGAVESEGEGAVPQKADMALKLVVVFQQGKTITAKGKVTDNFTNPADLHSRVFPNGKLDTACVTGAEK